MLWILVKKEILETVLDLRFVVASLLCLVFFPLGMYVNRVDYEQRLSTYHREHQSYRDRYSDQMAIDVEVQGFRPPAVMSVFVSGLDAFVPDRVTTSSSGVFRATKEAGTTSPLSLLFGKADFLFNVVFLVSLAALIFTFNSITGEKEKGTLCLQVANSVSRGRILLAKIVGSYLALMVPFFLSLGIALLLLNASLSVSLGQAEVFRPVLALMAVTLLFVLCMVTLGVCLSTYSRHSSAVVVRLFLVWVILVLILPGASSMAAEAFLSVESEHVVRQKKRRLAESLNEEIDAARKRIVQESFQRNGLQLAEHGHNVIPEARPGEDPETAEERRMRDGRQAMEEATSEIFALVPLQQRRLATQLQQFEEDHRNRRNAQSGLALMFSRVSPVSCYAHIAAGICQTGIAEPENFIRNAQRFQRQTEQAVYGNYIRWGLIRGYKPGFDRKNPPPLPDMTYSYPPLLQVLTDAWPDLVMLCLFPLLFYALAHRRFMTYDVR